MFSGIDVNGTPGINVHYQYTKVYLNVERLVNTVNIKKNINRKKILSNAIVDRDHWTR